MAAENIYYAPMKLQSAFLFSMCTLTLAAHAQPVFVEGVSLDGGWYDCNKTTKWNWQASKPTGYYSSGDWILDDSAMCWAHAASNILQWWQDGQASALPAVAPNGASNTAVPYYASGTGLVRSLLMTPCMCSNLPFLRRLVKTGLIPAVSPYRRITGTLMAEN